jgi:hypothetical protein
MTPRRLNSSPTWPFILEGYCGFCFPSAAPPPSASEIAKIGIVSISLEDKALCSSAGQLEKTISTSRLKPRSHTIRAVIGRFNGQTCVCEKTFHVLACPEVDAQVKEPIEPDSGCLPARVTYDLDWPGDSEMCGIPYRELGDSRPLERFGPFPITKTYSIIRRPYGEGHHRSGGPKDTQLEVGKRSIHRLSWS